MFEKEGLTAGVRSLPDAFHTLKIMREAPVLIVGASVQNILLTATELGYGTLWIANTCFAYNELVNFMGIKGQLVGAVSLGIANETPDQRPRKDFLDVVEFR